RAGGRPPVIEHVRDVADVRRRDALDDAEKEVPVLRAVVAWTEPAHVDYEPSRAGAQVGGEVLRPEEVGIPVGLEVRPVAATVAVDLVLVGVDELRVRMAVDLDREQV